MLTLPGIHRYEQSFDTVQGWMHYADLVLFDLVLAHQLDADITGDLLEIGAYHGKSAIVMGYGLREEERLVVNDLFGPVNGEVPSEGMEAYVGLQVETFMENYDRFHHHSRTQNPEIHICPSSVLGLDEDLFRFTHIDGGHAYNVVVGDLYLAYNHTAPRGIICLDDFRTSHCPGVSAAAWEASSADVLYPVILSDAKMYAATNLADYTYWLAVARGFGLPWDTHSIFGRDVLRIGYSW